MSIVSDQQRLRHLPSRLMQVDGGMSPSTSTRRKTSAPVPTLRVFTSAHGEPGEWSSAELDLYLDLANSMASSDEEPQASTEQESAAERKASAPAAARE